MKHGHSDRVRQYSRPNTSPARNRGGKRGQSKCTAAKAVALTASPQPSPHQRAVQRRTTPLNTYSSSGTKTKPAIGTVQTGNRNVTGAGWKSRTYPKPTAARPTPIRTATTNVRQRGRCQWDTFAVAVRV